MTLFGDDAPAEPPAAGRRRKTDRPALILVGGPRAGFGYYVDEFHNRQADRRQAGNTPADCVDLRYQPTGRTTQNTATGATVQVWEYTEPAPTKET